MGKVIKFPGRKEKIADNFWEFHKFLEGLGLFFEVSCSQKELEFAIIGATREQLVSIHIRALRAFPNLYDMHTVKCIGDAHWDVFIAAEIGHD